MGSSEQLNIEGISTDGLRGTFRVYTESDFIGALAKTKRVEVVCTSSEEWPENDNWPSRVAVRVRMALDAGKAVVIEKDGSYRYYVVDETRKGAHSGP
jgi:hypothetical protein